MTATTTTTTTPATAAPPAHRPPADQVFLALSRRYWHAIARAQDVVPGALVGVTLLDEQLVVGRTLDGDLFCFPDLCSHRGVRLSMGTVLAEGCVRCPYHGWRFAPDGTCVGIPQLGHERIPRAADLRSFRVEEQAGLVWTCLVDPTEEAAPRPTFPEGDADDMDLFVGEPLDWACQSFREIENFCDVAHFSILHADTFGNAREPVIAEHRVERREGPGGQVLLDFAVPYASCDPFAAPDDEGHRPSFPATFHYEVQVPFTVRLEGAAGPGTVMWVHSTPTSAHTCRIFWDTAFPASAGTDLAAYAEFEEKVWGPDQAIVEGQRPEALPVDLTEELHLPFDRFAVAYRRALTDLGYVR